MDAIWNALVERGMTIAEVDQLKHTYILLMMIPIVTSIVGIARYIVGVQSLNIYSTIVLTFAFYDIGYENDRLYFFQGLKIGLVMFLTIFISSALLYYFVLKKFRMHFVPKATLAIIGTSISVIILMLLGAYFGKFGLVFLDFFTLIIMVSLSDILISNFAKKNLRYSINTSIQSIAISLLGYILISWQEFQQLILDRPYVILLAILINIYVGKFVGLRLTEYWRFRNLLTQEDVENINNTKK